MQTAIVHKGETVIESMEYVDVTTFKKGKREMFAARRKYFNGSRLIYGNKAMAIEAAEKLNAQVKAGNLV